MSKSDGVSRGLVSGLRVVALLVLGVMVSGCSGEPPAPGPGGAAKAFPVMKWLDPAGAQAGEVLASWSLIVGNEPESAQAPDVLPLTVVARFVVQGAGQDCGGFRLVAEGGEAAEALAPVERQNPDAQAFPVTLCQQVLPADWPAATLHRSGQGEPVRRWLLPDAGADEVAGAVVRFPGPYEVGRKRPGEIVMVTTGDTGCRGDEEQSQCKDRSTDWPFHRLVRIAAAEFNPDLVVHVGDYRYYHEGDTPDTWAYWYQDFFYPAQPLLSNAPWAFSRGNHEQCHNNWGAGYYWYGQGWFYFFEPTTSTETARCPSGTQTVQVPAWAFDVAVKSSGDAPQADRRYRFVLLDTAPDFPSDTTARQDFERTMAGNFQQARNLATSQDSWWVTHRPVVSLAYYASHGGSPAWHYDDDDVRQVLATALAGSSLCAPACKPSAMVTGHIHFYQAIDFYAPGSTEGDWVWPRQVIVGNGGVVDVGGLNTSPCTHSDFPLPVATEGVVRWNTQHGFTAWSRSEKSARSPSGWLEMPYFLPGSGTAAPSAENGELAPCGPAS